MDEKKCKFVEGKTPVSQLQERLIRNGITPKYELVYDSTTRPCGVTKFTWQVSIEDIVVHGTGNTKKSAKQDAAKNMLIQISTNDEIGSIKKLSLPTGDNFVNRVGNLSMFCSRNSLPAPTYKEYESDGPPHIRQFFCDCEVSRYFETGIAKTKKEAKQRAARQMYEKLLTSITNPNDATVVDRMSVPEFPCKIEKTDPWLKSEKIASRGMEPLESSDGEEYGGMSPEPNYEAPTSSDVDPTQAVDYRPDYGSADHPEDSSTHEEMLEKKFKINLSLFARSNVYKEAQSTESNASVDEECAKVERNGGSVKTEKMEDFVRREEANEAEPAGKDDFHCEVKPKVEATMIALPDTTEPVKIKAERLENSFESDVDRPPDLGGEINGFDHEIKPKIEVMKRQEEIHAPDQPEPTSEKGETLLQAPAEESAMIDSKSSIENLLNTIKTKYPELLQPPEEQIIQADSTSSNCDEKSSQFCKKEMMETEEMIEDDFTPQEKTENLIEMNNNDSTSTEQESLDVRNPSLMPIITMPSESIEKSSSDLQNHLNHMKKESEINSILIKPEIIVKSDFTDQLNVDAAQNGGGFNAETIISNNSESKTRMKEFSKMRVSEYHHMMMNDYGVDLRGKVLDKIRDLMEAMKKCDSKNPQVVNEGMIVLHDILLMIDLYLCKVIYRAHDLHYIVLIHVNSISEIVEVTKGRDLNEITRTAFFRVIERVKKLLQ